MGWFLYNSVCKNIVVDTVFSLMEVLNLVEKFDIEFSSDLYFLEFLKSKTVIFGNLSIRFLETRWINFFLVVFSNVLAVY